jgi:hypothetical protein
MLSTVKRRMSALERSIRIPITANILLARAEERARLTGASFDEALHSLIASLATPDLECIAEEHLKRTFGDDVEAREAYRRKIASDILGEGTFEDQV